jgi:pyruvate formate lyase activating enzyme
MEKSIQEALLYEKLADDQVRCHLCAHECRIPAERKGLCHVRENREGTLYTLVYGRTISRQIDPVEKKPLYHFYPGSRAYSVATVGCNMRCQWCQNADISQMPRERHFLMGEEASPSDIVQSAQRAGCQSIAYTYTEPTIFFEYAYDISVEAREQGIANIFVTNGFMTGEMLDRYHPHLDAANVDLKAFREETYRKYIGARLQPVLDSMIKMKERGVWLEVTTLLIPGLNDEEKEIREAAGFIGRELGEDTPWHLSRFYPSYQMQDTPPTPIPTLERAREIGREEGLRYIYLGNIPGEANTLCHQCGHQLIKRSGHRTVSREISGADQCPRCGAALSGVGLSQGAG